MLCQSVERGRRGDLAFDQEREFGGGYILDIQVAHAQESIVMARVQPYDLIWRFMMFMMNVYEDI
jgi:hypothetical protein